MMTKSILLSGLVFFAGWAAEAQTPFPGVAATVASVAECVPNSKQEVQSIKSLIEGSILQGQAAVNEIDQLDAAPGTKFHPMVDVFGIVRGSGFSQVRSNLVQKASSLCEPTFAAMVQRVCSQVSGREVDTALCLSFCIQERYELQCD